MDSFLEVCLIDDLAGMPSLWATLNSYWMNGNNRGPFTVSRFVRYIIVVESRSGPTCSGPTFHIVQGSCRGLQRMQQLYDTKKSWLGQMCLWKWHQGAEQAPTGHTPGGSEPGEYWVVQVLQHPERQCSHSVKMCVHVIYQPRVDGAMVEGWREGTCGQYRSP